MKPDIHPDYVVARVHCSCGNEFLTRATKPELTVEICSECHPFYTGKQKLVDTGGRVERFRRRQARSQRNCLTWSHSIKPLIAGARRADNELTMVVSL